MVSRTSAASPRGSPAVRTTIPAAWGTRVGTCYDHALDVDTLFHGAAVVIEPIPMTLQHLAGRTPVFPAGQRAELREAV
jgi:hypothetical protein